MFVSGKPLQPSLMFVGKAMGPTPERKTWKFGLDTALTANIGLSWESLPETNTLAYYENL